MVRRGKWDVEALVQVTAGMLLLLFLLAMCVVGSVAVFGMLEMWGL